MKRGEIWLVGLDPTQGHEQKGRRPVLIVSPEAFNRVTKVPVVLPNPVESPISGKTRSCIEHKQNQRLLSHG